MKNTLRKITATTFAAMLLCTQVSCGKDNEEINDSQESTNEQNSFGKTEITLGMPAFNNQFFPNISKFNDSSKDYVIKTVDYSKLVDDDADGTKAMNQMKTDLVTGSAPDIIILNSIYMMDFVNTGAFTDMYELMEQYDGVKKSDFIPNIIEGFEVNGKVPAISYGFFIDTAVAKTELVGVDKENWTPAEAMEVYYSMPDGMSFCANFSETSLADYMMKKSADSSVDLANYTCNFTNGEFAKLLNFCRDNPVRTEYESEISSGSSYFSENQLAILNNKQLIAETEIRNFGQDIGNELWTNFGGEDITFVGYPSESGCGALTSSLWMFGISKDCENKEAAWQFINYMLSSDFQKSVSKENSGLPVIRSVLDGFLENKDREDSASIYYSRLYDGGEYPEGEYISDETVQKLYDYILSVDFDPYRSVEIDDIVKEEYSAVIAGEKSGEECADILQSRVSIYLSEKK